MFCHVIFRGIYPKNPTNVELKKRNYLIIYRLIIFSFIRIIDIICRRTLNRLIIYLHENNNMYHITNHYR